MFEFLFGFLLGALTIKLYMMLEMYLIEKRLEKRIDEVLTKFRSHLINSKIEVVNDVYFMYDRDTNAFLAQGNSFEELNQNAMKKYPDKLFNVPHNELMEVMKANNENR